MILIIYINYIYKKIMYVKEVCYLKKYELNCGEYKFKSKNWNVYEKLLLIIYEMNYY